MWETITLLCQLLIQKYCCGEGLKVRYTAAASVTPFVIGNITGAVVCMCYYWRNT